VPSIASVMDYEPVQTAAGAQGTTSLRATVLKKSATKRRISLNRPVVIQSRFSKTAKISMEMAVRGTIGKMPPQRSAPLAAVS